SALFNESGASNVKSKADGAADASNRVPGLRSALFNESGAGTVKSKADSAADASNRVPGLYSALFSESGANNVMGQAGGIQSSINNINKNPTVRFGGRIFASLSSAISRGNASICSVLSGSTSADRSLTSSRYKPGKADLLSVNTYAHGGFENHTAQIASPKTPFRILAEPETGGEAYIPMSPAKRARSLAIWEEVGRRFGVYANGGVTDSQTSAGTGGDIYNIYMNRDSVTPKDLMNEVTHQRRRKGR